MSKSNLPKSIRKYLRRKKSEIRRQFLDIQEAESKVEELVKEISEEDDKDKQNQQEIV